MIIKNGLVQKNFALKKQDLQIEDGKITKIADRIDGKDVIYADNLLIVPGGVDVHVHLREPGYAEKETIYTGTMSAAKGGITSVMAMPNLNPVPDNIKTLEYIFGLIRASAKVKVYPYAALTVGQRGAALSDIRGLARYVKGFSDDGRCVNDTALLYEAMLVARECGAVIASHAEAEGYGDAPEAEYIAVERELELVKKTGVKYHFCHLSTKKSFELFRSAKKDGLDITAEVTPHHLFLTEKDIKGTNFKMNPPLRRAQDAGAAVEALLDGTVTIIATDHAPHTEAEKARPYKEAPNGIIGLETLFPLVFTNLVKAGPASVSDMINWITVNPARRFGIPYSRIEEGSPADIAALDIINPHTYTTEEIYSKGKNSPFIGQTLYGFNKFTMIDGKIIYDRITEAKNG